MLDSEKFRRSKCYDGSFESNGHPGEHRQGGPPAPGPHRPGWGLLLRPSQRRTLLRAAPSWTGEPACCGRVRKNEGIKDLPIWKTDREVRLEDRYHPHRNLGRGSLLRGAGSPCPPQMDPEGEMDMKPDYRNWMPRGMIVGLGTATGVLAACIIIYSSQG